MNVTPFRKHPRHEPKHALFAEPDQSLPEALAAEAAKREDVPAAVTEAAYPYEDIPAGDAVASRETEHDPSWPDPLSPVIPVTQTVGAVIGDAINGVSPAAVTAVRLPEYLRAPRVPLDSRAQLYTERGWTEILTRARIGSGEWIDPYLTVRSSKRRVVTSLAMAGMNVQDAITECWRQVCIEVGRPDQILPGWRKIRDLAGELRREEALRRGEPVFTPKVPPAPPTAPQPALTEGRERAA